ncbi:hypothetical protein H6G25_05055 [Dolichospermum sp. FACHB-1091]|uniref:hypothetical protein n=1 Tax=Dolichospermum sp. FACHB-1091 TaxID=2692798 RepID=UPI001680AB74|nr:hypothetical protein [Dolichospermum sp. FACHB-1091]MBD2442579.1 hypothetical protein [Dolichospermum sp. FACHB-1091]
MLDYISKFITSSKLKFPVAGLVFSVGVLGIVYSSQQHQKLLSLTTLSTNYVSHNHQNEINSESSIRSRVGEIKQEKVKKSQVANSYQLSPDKLTENITTLSANTRKLGKKEKLQFPEQDGIYLYGQSSTPNQLGQGYIVFEKHQSKIIGALYVPQSEFSCFQGSLAKSGELAMTVKSYPGEAGTMEVATTSTIPKINENELTTYPYSVTLQDYQQLNSVSSNDREILQICQQESDGFR